MKYIRLLKNFVFGVLIVFLLTISASAFEWKTQRHVLDNGMVVLITEMPSSSIISIDALVKVGSATEEKYLGSGIAHFLEHMLFKGTEKRGAGEVAQDARAIGAIINASTSFDRTTYTIESPKGTFNEAFDIIADMVMNSIFVPEEVEREREVIYGEMRLREDNPARQLSQLVFETAYTRHPYQHPIIGYKPVLAQISRADLLDFYKTFYIPNNIILSVAGPVREAEILSQVEKTFKDFKPGVYLNRALPQEPSQISPRRIEKEFPTDLTRLSLVYQGVEILNEDLYALDVLAMVLGQGESSRLYQRLFKKEGLVRSVVSYNYTPMDRGLFEITCVLDEENVDAVLNAIQDELEQIKKRGVSLSELAKAKRQVLSGYIFSRQTSPGVGGGIAEDEAYVGDPQFSKKYVDAIRNVDSDDLKRVTKQYLKEASSSIVILKPESNVEGSGDDSGEPEKAEVKKLVLNNGLTVLLKEDHTFPIVSIRLAVNGGLREDPEGLEGLSNLMSQLWTQGTSQKSAAVISESVESRGGSVSGFSGRQSFGLNFDFLSEDLEFALDLLEEFVKSPSFPENEIVKEKEKVKTVLIAKKDQITASAWDALRESLFSQNSIRFDPLGNSASIAQITREDILRFYKRQVAPDNMVLAVFGDFDSKNLSALLKKKFGLLKPSNLTLKEESTENLDQQVEKAIEMDKQQAVVMVGFPGPDFKNADKYGVDILASILGSFMNGRIFIRVRDELGKAYTLGGSFVPTISAGIIYFYVNTTVEEIEKVKELLFEQFTELQQSLISDEELKNTKIYLKGTHEMGKETLGAQAFTSVVNELYGLGFDYDEQYNGFIDQVTKEDVQSLAKKYLNPQKSAVIVIKPVEAKN